MSESQRKEAKQIFKFLKETGIINVESSYHGTMGEFLIGVLSSEDEWIQKLTEAIADFKSNELKEMMTKAGMET